MAPKLTIGMATFDDFDGVYFSIQSLRMYFPMCMTDEVEFIVIDNNPNGKHGEHNKKLVKWLGPRGRYIPYTMRTTTAVKNEIFRNAKGKYTISMDCHVMFMPGALESLLSYYDANPECKDIVQGPLMYDGLMGCLTHFKPIWGKHMYGRWGIDKQGLASGEAFDIPMQGLGVFSCETKYWRGFNNLFKGFGGEEGYIHEKFRQMGGRSVCVPEFKWVHRFARPEGVKYPLKLEDRIWNYFIGWMELQGPEGEMVHKIEEVFTQSMANHKVREIRENARKALKL